MTHKQEPRAKINLDLKKEVHDKFRAICEAEERTMVSMLREVISSFVKNYKKREIIIK